MINYSFSIANFEYFLLILVRIASFVYIAPFFGQDIVLKEEEKYLKKKGIVLKKLNKLDIYHIKQVI